VSLLVGLAFATPVTALSSRLENDTGFNLLFRLGQTPLMLFSGTFFPVSQLPGWMQPVAWVTPLWHGVEAERALALGTGSLAGVLGHVAALVGFAAVGWVLALWTHDEVAAVSTSVATRLSRAVPIPAGAGLARMIVERNLTSFRHGWITLVTGFLEPVFYLFSLGVGLGALITNVTTDGGTTVPYAVFVAPALLASSAMNGAIFDSTFNVFFKLKYSKLYDSVLATRMGPRDIAIGELGWSLLRGTFYSAAFLVVAWLAGTVSTWWALLALPAATMIAFAFSAVGMFLTTFMRSWVDFDYVNLAILPMFLFSATFFPLSTYPESIRWLVEITPLYNGVALERGLMLGEVDAGLLWHVLYFFVLGAVGLLGTARRLERLLLS
jgi:lipooligosaccharide transport system permease protein